MGKRGDGYVRILGSEVRDVAAIEAGGKWEGAGATKAFIESKHILPKILRDILWAMHRRLNNCPVALTEISIPGLAIYGNRCKRPREGTGDPAAMLDKPGGVHWVLLHFECQIDFIPPEDVKLEEETEGMPALKQACVELLAEVDRAKAKWKGKAVLPDVGPAPRDSSNEQEDMQVKVQLLQVEITTMRS
ncbi:hypothetical protein HDU77_000280 [Chytriomyces hyalinus]|nr:hypothetical protein HDU77_000280 [Chytriomyces hyalinus]